MRLPVLRTYWQKLCRLFGDKPTDVDFEEETRAHLAMLADRFERQGMTAAAAQREARRQFGNTTTLGETRHEMQTFAWVERLWQDLRYAGRLLRLNPLFALTATVSLALGIGANAAIFQLIDSVRLRTLPVTNPGELARVAIDGGNHGMGVNDAYGDLTHPIWEELRGHPGPFSKMFAWGMTQVLVSDGGRNERASALLVSGELFQALGVQPWQGRLTVSDDEHACPATTAVVSYSYWQTKMGGQRINADTTLRIDGQPIEVVGVAPPQFFGLVVGSHFDVALPFCRPKALQRNLFNVMVMGRLRPGVSPAAASAELSARSPGIMAATEPPGYSPESTARYRAFRLSAYPAGTGVSPLRKQFDSSLSVLLAITGLVLLIACANLANLILARASARERELGVRLALGASRGRVFRQLLAENGLLALIGAAAGIAVAQAVSRAIVWSLSTESSMVSLPTSVDWRVLAFAAALGTLTCAVFGVIPALRAAATPPVLALRSGGRGLTGSAGRARLQRGLVVAQISVSLVLLVGALLFVRSFYNLMAFDPGMREAGITIAFLGYGQSNIPKERYLDFQAQLVGEIRGVPGVLGAASTTNPPLLGGGWGHEIHIGGTRGNSKFTWVGPEYFQTMGIPLLGGRGLRSSDTAQSERVAVVNETFVRTFLAGSDPIGQAMKTSPEPDYPATVYTIVGVIPDTRYQCLRCVIPPMAFAPASQFPAYRPWTAVMIHSSLPPETIAHEVGRLFEKTHPELPIQLDSFQRLIRDGLARDRLMALLSGLFGVLAAILAAVGLYGVIAYTVGQRRNEIGLRIALGAGRGEVVGMVIRQAARMLLVSVLLGTGLALLAGRAAGSLLFDLKPYDPATLAGAACLLTGIGLAASLVPAYRASRVDPIEALRCE